MLHGVKWKKENVVCQINLLIPQSHFVYTCQNLHAIPHGDERIQEKTNLDSVLKCSGVDVVDVITSTQVAPITAYYSSSELMMGIARRVKDIDSMQMHLFDHLFDIYEVGKANGSRDSNGARVDFGLGQIQSTSKTFLDKRGKRHRLPHCNLNSFHLMNDALQAELSELLLYFHWELNGKKGPHNGCNDDWRTEFVSNIFHDAGWVGPFLGWEYINVSLRSAEDTLHKHFDSKNDRRLGYNHAAVYSFVHSHSNKEYRVVIVMTFRNSMGCFMDSVRDMNA